jgi:hypothetical protein
MNHKRIAFLSAMILAAAAARFIPHPPDFSPVAAMALFGGASFGDKRTAFLVPLAGLALSDLVLGFHAITPVVYAGFALMVCLGLWIRQRPSIPRTAAACVAAGVLFFLLANLGVWALYDWYPKTPAGLMQCYTAALPYLKNTVCSSLLYAGLLFGGWKLAEHRALWLQEERGTAV